MKLSLIIQTGSLAGRKFELTNGFLTIGRGERCNIRFDPLGERIASKEHCFIEAKSDGFYLTDNQSTNGTIFNGEKIQSVKLNAGDRIQFGKNGVQAVIQIESFDASSQQTSVMPNLPQPIAANQLPSQDFQQPSAVTQLAPNLQQIGTMPYPPPIQSDFYMPQPTRAFQDPSVNLRNSLQNLGMGGLPPQYFPEPEKSQTGKYIGIAIGIIGLLICLLMVILIMFLSVGPVTAFVATFVAFIPAMFYIIPFMLLDRYDPEPVWLLALAFSWGALVSVVFSFFANTIVGIGAAVAVNPDFGEGLMAVAAAPIFEEGSKGLGLLLLLIFFRKYFDDVLDGIVFAGVIALGFATVENILYYGRGMNGGGIIGLILLFLLRGVLSPFAHATFTSMTGIGCGISRESHKSSVRLIFPVLGYMAAVCLHALWNGMAVFAGKLIKDLNIGWLCEYINLTGNLEGLCAFLLSYAFLEVPLFFGFIGFAIYIMRRQNKILKEMLAIDVARGLIPEEHLKIATSVYHSIGWLIGSVFSGKFGARNKYLRSIGKLGLSYWHIQRATAAQGQTASFQQNPILRAEVIRWRNQV
ncbi:MAG: PrsW family glutamic-type intramembrane protease [Actinomycetota bacterium]